MATRRHQDRRLGSQEAIFVTPTAFFEGVWAGNLHFPWFFIGSRGEWACRPDAEIVVLVAVGEGRMGGGEAESSNLQSHSLVAPGGLADMGRTCRVIVFATSALPTGMVYVYA